MFIHECYIVADFDNAIHYVVRYIHSGGRRKKLVGGHTLKKIALTNIIQNIIK
jgi:hypothetical protein